MPNFTKTAIKMSFMKLLSEKPLSEISVRSIVEDCGINRNSFYYHFQDIPALIEELVMEYFDELIRKYPSITSLGDGVHAALQFILENKKAILHIYNSVSRDIFEIQLMRFCEKMVCAYLETVFSDTDVSESDRNLIARFFKCELFGAYIDWINSGMPKSVVEDVDRILEICNGLSDDIIMRCRATEAE